MHSNRYFGNRKTLESQWKAIYKPRLPKRGVSEKLRQFDSVVGTASYDVETFVSKVAGSDSDVKRFFKGLSDLSQALSDIERKYAKDGWTTAEKAFLGGVHVDLEDAKDYWKRQLTLRGQINEGLGKLKKDFDDYTLRMERLRDYVQTSETFATKLNGQRTPPVEHLQALDQNVKQLQKSNLPTAHSVNLDVMALVVGLEGMKKHAISKSTALADRVQEVKQACVRDQAELRRLEARLHELRLWVKQKLPASIAFEQQIEKALKAGVPRRMIEGWRSGGNPEVIVEVLAEYGMSEKDALAVADAVL